MTSCTETWRVSSLNEESLRWHSLKSVTTCFFVEYPHFCLGFMFLHDYFDISDRWAGSNSPSRLQEKQCGLNHMWPKRGSTPQQSL